MRTETAGDWALLALAVAMLVVELVVAAYAALARLCKTVSWSASTALAAGLGHGFGKNLVTFVEGTWAVSGAS